LTSRERPASIKSKKRSGERNPGRRIHVMVVAQSVDSSSSFKESQILSKGSKYLYKRNETSGSPSHAVEILDSNISHETLYKYILMATVSADL
jgi:hypothetical protein